MTPLQQRPTPSPLNSVNNAPPPPLDERHPETTLPTKLFKKISIKRSSASRVPERLLLHRHHGDGAQYQLNDTRPKPHSALSEVRFQDIHPGVRVQTPDTSKEPRFGEWKAPVYKPPIRKAQTTSTVPQVQWGATVEPDAIPRSLRDEVYSTFEPFKGQKWQPEEYQALLHEISPQSPDTFLTESSFEPSPITAVRPWSELIQTSQMVPRISDVMEYPAMIPEYLETENERPRTLEYQPSSSATFGLGEMMGSSHYDQYAGMRNSGQDSERTHRPGSAEPQTRGSGRRGSTTKHHRMSLQHGVTEAYDLMHRRIASVSKHKPELTQKGHKSTADISTVEQEKARSRVKLHMSKSSVNRVRELSKSRSASRGSAPSSHDEGRRSRGSREIKRSRPGPSDISYKERFSGKKLIAALQNGSEKVAIRAKDVSSHRHGKGEELKKKIVVVLPGQREGEEF